MPDEPTGAAPVSTPVSTPPANPATNPPATTTPAAPDSVELAKEVGRLKAVAEEFETYKQKVDPVLETVWGDQELFQNVADKHNKRLGFTPDDKKDDKKSTPETVPNKDVQDLRQKEIKDTIDGFRSEHKLTDLSEEARNKVEGRMLEILKENLDPNNNKKNIQEVFQDVSLVKLPKFLDDAYYLATKDEQKKAAYDAGLNAATTGGDVGVIGSMASGSVNSSGEVTITNREREIALKQGITPEQYLDNKKRIMTRNNTPI